MPAPRSSGPDEQHPCHRLRPLFMQLNHRAVRLCNYLRCRNAHQFALSRTRTQRRSGSATKSRVTVRKVSDLCDGTGRPLRLHALQYVEAVRALPWMGGDQTPPPIHCFNRGEGKPERDSLICRPRRRSSSCRCPRGSASRTDADSRLGSRPRTRSPACSSPASDARLCSRPDDRRRSARRSD